MGSISSEEIISILKTEIENYDMVSKDQEVGTVIWVGDGIATIYGIEHAMYGEIVIFENGVRGMVQDIKRDQVGCIIFGKDTEIKEGTKVTRTKKKVRSKQMITVPSSRSTGYRRQTVRKTANGDRYPCNRLHVPNRTWTA